MASGLHRVGRTPILRSIGQSPKSALTKNSPAEAGPSCDARKFPEGYLEIKRLPSFIFAFVTLTLGFVRGWSRHLAAHFGQCGTNSNEKVFQTSSLKTHTYGSDDSDKSNHKRVLSCHGSRLVLYRTNKQRSTKTNQTMFPRLLLNRPDVV